MFKGFSIILALTVVSLPYEACAWPFSTKKTEREMAAYVAAEEARYAAMRAANKASFEKNMKELQEENAKLGIKEHDLYENVPGWLEMRLFKADECYRNRSPC